MVRGNGRKEDVFDSQIYFFINIFKSIKKFLIIYVEMIFKSKTSLSRDRITKKKTYFTKVLLNV